MKKVILALIFVFATGTTFMNASANLTLLNEVDKQDTYADCITQSNATYDFMIGFTGDPTYAFNISEAQLSDCLDEADFLEEAENM